jgi:hypothetical protein
MQSKLETNGRGKLRMLAPIPLLMLCAACGPKDPVLVLPPVTLAECADEPLPPDIGLAVNQIERDNLTLAYLLALRAAWGDCRARVDGLKAWMDAAGE